MKKSIVSSLAAALVLAGATCALAFENITPTDAYNKVATGDAYILDVRTPGEWTWIGHPGKNKLGEGAAIANKVVNIAYMIDKEGTLVVNPSFMNEVKEMFEDKTGATLIAMCRSGQRSAAAAAELEAAGYTVMNMTTGFQGGTDAKGYRTKNGWVVNGLPYSYSGAGAYPD